MEDSGALPIEMNVDNMRMGDIVSIYPYEGETRRYDDYALINKFELKATTIDNVRAGGRINLIIGKALTNKAQNILKNTRYF